MRVLGVDPGLRTTGWAVLDARGALVDCGRWRVRPGEPAATTVALARGLRAVIDRHRPEVLGVELQFVNFKRGHQDRAGLAALRGALTLVASEAGLRVVGVQPQAAKAALAFGGADKAAMVAHANARFGLELTQREADVADALGVALAGRRELAPLTQVAMSW